MLPHAAPQQQGMRFQQKVKGLLPLQPAHPEDNRLAKQARRDSGKGAEARRRRSALPCGRRSPPGMLNPRRGRGKRHALAQGVHFLQVDDVWSAEKLMFLTDQPAGKLILFPAASHNRIARAGRNPFSRFMAGSLPMPRSVRKKHGRAACARKACPDCGHADAPRRRGRNLPSLPTPSTTCQRGSARVKVRLPTEKYFMQHLYFIYHKVQKSVDFACPPSRQAQLLCYLSQKYNLLNIL